MYKTDLYRLHKYVSTMSLKKNMQLLEVISPTYNHQIVVSITHTHIILTINNHNIKHSILYFLPKIFL